MDLFSFSIPYLAEQVSSMLVSVIGKSQGGISPLTPTEKTGFVQALKDNEIEEASKKKMEKMEILRNKVKAIARMQRIFSNLRYLLNLFRLRFNIGHTMIY